eukprot:COSAG03_NODE_1266_length_4438_cov_8.476838_4_plen_104_part_00
MSGRVQRKANAGYSQAAIDFEERWGEIGEEARLSARDLCGTLSAPLCLRLSLFARARFSSRLRRRRRRLLLLLLRRKTLVGYLLAMAVLTWAFAQIAPDGSVV